MNTETKALEISSSEIVASLDDILTQILVRLPLKSYTRFQSVSKHWQSLISEDPGLPILLNPNPNPASGLIFQFCPNTTHHDDDYAIKPLSARVLSFDSLTNRKLKFPKHPDQTKILSSCNGLLLCGSFASNYIFNPITNSYSSLPRNFFGNEQNICSTILAFDPSKSSPHYYKVVCVRRINSDPPSHQLEVYSSETRLWRKRSHPFIAEHVDFEDGVYWNGAIHWVGFTTTAKSFYFDPDVFSEPKLMPAPPVLYHDGGFTRDRYFGESCGHLHFVQVHKRTFYQAGLSSDYVCEKRMGIVEREFNVYEMRRDYSEWFVKYRVDTSSVVNGVDAECISILSLVRGKKDDDDSFLVLVIDKKVVRYNLVGGTCEKINEFDDFPLNPDVSFQFPYIELLCPV